MACSCKDKNKIEENIYASVDELPLLEKAWYYIRKFTRKLFTIIMFMILIPIVMLTIIFNYITKGELFFKFPYQKLSKLLKIDGKQLQNTH